MSWRFQLVLILAALRLLSLEAGAAVKKRECREMTLVICDLAGLDDTTKRFMKAKADEIFEKAYIRITWVETCVKMPALPQYFVVVFVANPQTEWASRDALGFAPIRIGEQRRAYVFVNRVKELLDLVAPGQLRLSIFGSALALALTHETGHLLMPGETIHAKNGIMSTRWSYEQWIEARQGNLLFLPDEVRSMHRALEASQPRVQAANGRKFHSR
jgi:hypothetical protein